MRTFIQSTVRKKKGYPAVEPLYKISIEPSVTEKDLMDTFWFQRLKYIHHSGVDFTFSYKTHTTYQHSLGVYALATVFYPNNLLIRVTALLHEIGYPPFCCAVENAYAVVSKMVIENTKKTYESAVRQELVRCALTKNILFKTEISNILRKRMIPPRLVYDLAEGIHNSPINPKNEELIGLDMLDCLIRDMYYNGLMKASPSSIIRRINVDEMGVSTDLRTGMKIHRLIIKNYEHKYSKEAIVRSALAQRLLEYILSSKRDIKKEIVSYTEYDIMKEAIELANKNQEIKRVLDSLLYTSKFRIIKFNPDELLPDDPDDEKIRYSVKACGKDVLIEKNGVLRPLKEVSKQVAKDLIKLRKYTGTYTIAMR